MGMREHVVGAATCFTVVELPSFAVAAHTTVVLPRFLKIYDTLILSCCTGAAVMFILWKSIDNDTGSGGSVFERVKRKHRMRVDCRYWFQPAYG